MFRRTPLRPRVAVGPAAAIPSQDTCDRLIRAMAYVPAGSQNFARSLIQNHETYRGWSPKQAEHAELLLERARETYRAMHRKPGAAPAPEGVRLSHDTMSLLRVFFSEGHILANAAFTLKPAKDGGGILFEPKGAYMGMVRATGLLDLRQAYQGGALAIADAISNAMAMDD